MNWGKGSHVYNSLHKGLPDLGDFIDVMKPDHRLVVAEDDRPDFAYLLIDGSRHPTYKIKGWLWGYEVKIEDNFDPEFGRAKEPAYVVKNHKPFHDPMELYEIIHGTVGTYRDRIVAHRSHLGLPG
jgi:hypothetical protein